MKLRDIYKGNLDWLCDNTIFLCVYGSQAYGLNTPESDLDIRGIVIPPAKYFLGYSHTFEQAEIKNEIDGVIYNIQKFFKLAAEGNPSIIEQLFVDQSDVLDITKEGEEILAIRNSFLSKKIKFTFGGYANSQLKRCEAHRRWLRDESKMQKPTRAQFNLPEQNTLSAEIRGAAEKLEVVFSDSVMEILQNEKKYAAACREYENYLTWKNTRNAKRSVIERRIGYDCYSDDTEFLTKDGWKKFEEINKDDLLATIFINNSNRKMDHRANHLGIEYQKYIDKFEGLYTGSMYNITGNHTDVLVTPNHKLLLEEVNRSGSVKNPWGFTEAALAPDTFNVLRTITPLIKNYSYHDKLQGLSIKPPKLMKIAGWYLSDGHAVFSKKGKIKEIVITQKYNGKISAAMKKTYKSLKNVIRCTFRTIVLKPNKLRKTTCKQISLAIQEPSIVELIVNDFGFTTSKKVPRWVFTQSKQIMENLVNGMLGGDGTLRYTGSYIYYTTLPQLANDINELAVLCGWETSVYGPYNKNSNDGIVRKPIYQIHINKNTTNIRQLIRSKNISKIDVINQKIVCFTVPNSTLITRRNGHVAFHGNSKHVCQLIRLFQMACEILATGEVRVKRPVEEREWLIGMKTGNTDWTYDDVMNYVEKKTEELEKLYLTSTLPHTPNHNLLNEKLQDIISNFLF